MYRNFQTGQVFLIPRNSNRKPRHPAVDLVGCSDGIFDGGRGSRLLQPADAAGARAVAHRAVRYARGGHNHARPRPRRRRRAREVTGVELYNCASFASGRAASDAIIMPAKEPSHSRTAYPSEITDAYEIGETLGTGHFSKVVHTQCANAPAGAHCSASLC